MDLTDLEVEEVEDNIIRVVLELRKARYGEKVLRRAIAKAERGSWLRLKRAKAAVAWSDDEIELGNKIIEKYVGSDEFGCLLVSDRFGTQYGKYDEDSYQNDKQKIEKLLKDNELPYFYWTYKPINDTEFNFIKGVLDMHNMDLRIQLYIKSKAKLNISNQCGTNQMVSRYSNCYEIQRQFPIAHNLVKGETYL